MAGSSAAESAPNSQARGSELPMLRQISGAVDGVTTNLPFDVVISQTIAPFG